MKGWICALLILLACAQPTDSRAYFKYVPPQPLAERFKYKVIKRFEAKITRFIKPRPGDYPTKVKYLKALRLNGNGITRFHEKAYPGLIAANLKQFKPGTIIRIPEMNLVEPVKDRCPRAEKEARRGSKTAHFDVFADMTEKEALKWGTKKMTVEVLELVVSDI